MRDAYILITPEMHYDIRQRADEMRMLRHAPKLETSPTIQDDLEYIGVEPTVINFTGKLRFFLPHKPDNKQAYHLKDQKLLVIPIKTPRRSCKIDDYVRIAHSKLGDIFPGKFKYGDYLIRLFGH